MIYNLYTDGGSRGNPGDSAFGCVLYDEDGLLIDLESGYLGIMTNNQAEYEGIIAGLKLAKKYGVKNLLCHMDSELIVKQVNGFYKVKNSSLKKYYEKVISLVADFEECKFVHVYREKNKVADKLGNLILDAVLKK